MRIDGTSVRGRWIGTADGRHIRLGVDEGERELALDDLERITFEPSEAAETNRPESRSDSDAKSGGGAVFYLADGGRLFARLTATPEEPDVLAARTAVGDVVLPFRALAGVRLADANEFRRAAKAFDATLRKRPVAEDTLVTRRTDDVRVVPGRVVRLDSAGAVFALGGQERSISGEKVFGIVFAAGASAAGPSDPVTVRVRDGSSFSGRIQRGDGEVLIVATSWQEAVRVPLSLVEELTVRSDRVVYLSDLKPRSERIEGLLHAPWPVMWDRGVGGGPITMGGQEFGRGLGVHSFTELSFALDGAYESFAATIGLDDSVRPRGSVVFRVLGDDRVLLDSGIMRGTDGPRPVLIDVTGVHLLTLVVDYGDDLDLSDHANWGSARLIKPAGRTREGT